MATRNERRRKAAQHKKALDEQFRKAWVDYQRECKVRDNLGRSNKRDADAGFTSSVVLVAQGRQHGGNAQAKWGFSAANKRRIARAKG